MRYAVHSTSDAAYLQARGPRVYLAGPMTGLPGWNYPAFNTAARLLRHAGVPVHSPAEQHGGKTGLPREEYMRHALTSVLTCAAVVVLPGWEDSAGALLEVVAARGGGIPAYAYGDFMDFLAGGAEPEEVSVDVSALPTIDDSGHFESWQYRQWSTVEPESATEPESPRASLLNEARTIITGDRNNTYGPPDQDFRRTAGMLNALGFTHEGATVRAHHVAMIIAVVKLSRLTWSPNKRDNWTDLAGYAACGYECAVIEESNKEE